MASWTEAFVVAARGLAAAGAGRRAHRWPAHRRGLLRLRQVRPGRPRHQRHRLPGPPAQRRGGRLPGLRRGAGRLGGPTCPTPTSSRPRWSCWPGSSPRTRPAWSSCGCARPPRQAARATVVSLAPYTSRGLRKMNGRLLPTAPGEEAAALAALSRDHPDRRRHGAPGRRAAGHLARCAERGRRTSRARREPGWPGCRVGPVTAVRSRPARCPTCCPVAARSPTPPPGSTWPPPGGALAARRTGPRHRRDRRRRRAGELGGLVVAGVDPDDLADPVAARAALDRAAFVVSLEVRASEVTAAADVVFPVAPSSEKSGSFVGWDGRVRTLRDGARGAGVAARPAGAGRDRRGARPPARLPHRRGGPRRDARRSGRGRVRGRSPARRSTSRPRAVDEPRDDGTFVLASWKQLLDDGRMQDGDEHLRATARPAVLLMSPTPSLPPGWPMGETVTLTGPLGAVQIPVACGRSRAGCGVGPGQRAGALGATPGRAGRVCGQREHGSKCGRRAMTGPGADGARGLRPRRGLGGHPQGRPDLRGAGRPHPVQHLVGAARRGPDAAPDRAQRARSVRPAAEPGRRREAGAEGRHHPQGRRQAGLRHGAGALGDPRVPGLRGDPVRARGDDPVHGHPHPAAADRHAGRGAVRARDRLDRDLRHRAGRLVERVDVLPARRAALERPDDLLRGRDGPRPGRRSSCTPARCRPARSSTPRRISGSRCRCCRAS